jgi:hypothetical protein
VRRTGVPAARNVACKASALRPRATPLSMDGSARIAEADNAGAL